MPRVITFSLASFLFFFFFHCFSFETHLTSAIAIYSGTTIRGGTKRPFRSPLPDPTTRSLKEEKFPYDVVQVV